MPVGEGQFTTTYIIDDSWTENHYRLGFAAVQQQALALVLLILELEKKITT